MNIKVLAFGQIQEIMGKDNLNFSEIPDSEALKTKLSKEYPEVARIPYSIAVNKNMVNTNQTFKDGDVVALLPPFSGG